MVKKPQPIPSLSQLPEASVSEPDPFDLPPAEAKLEPEVGLEPAPLSPSEKLDLALRSTEQPISETIVSQARLGLEDLSIEHQLELAQGICERIGKAAGYIPDFSSCTENMKGAYLSSVRDVWLAAQRKARGYNE